MLPAPAKLGNKSLRARYLRILSRILLNPNEIASPFVGKIAKSGKFLAAAVKQVLQQSRTIGLFCWRRSIAVAARPLHRCACTFKYTAWRYTIDRCGGRRTRVNFNFRAIYCPVLLRERSYRLDRIELSPWTFLESWPARARQRHRQRSISGKIHHEMKQKERLVERGEGERERGREVYGSLITIILTWN